MTSRQRFIWPFEGLYHLDDYLRELDKTDGSQGFPKWEQWVEDNNLVIQFLVAGYSREDFSVYAQQDKITVEAQKAQKQKNSRFAGRAFKQSLQDPHGCWDFQSADITYKNGILKLVIPMKKESNSHKLTIR
jgi:HSP20 family molecular chaperone IbpA